MATVSAALVSSGGEALVTLDELEREAYLAADRQQPYHYVTNSNQTAAEEMSEPNDDPFANDLEAGAWLHGDIESET